MHTSFPKIANRIIEWGIIFLIVFTPLAFGTVHPWAYTVMELTICFLIIIWILKLAIINIKKTSRFTNLQASHKSQTRAVRSILHRVEIPDPCSAKHTSPGPGPCSAKHTSPGSIPQSLNSSIPQSSLVNRFGFIKTPLNIPIMLFVGLVLFQLTPLPSGVLKLLSPNTYKLYQTTSLGLCSAKHTSPGRNPKSKLPDLCSAKHTSPGSIPQSLNSSIPQSSIPNWRPISTYPHATKTELYKILAYIGIFFLIINYSPSTRSTQPVTREHPRLTGGHRLQIKKFITRLVIVLIVVGCFESIYGLLEYLSGHQYIFFRKKTLNLDFVTGTYINLHHFAGYMAIIICMSFGYLTYKLSRLSNSYVSLRVRSPICRRQRPSRSDLRSVGDRDSTLRGRSLSPRARMPSGLEAEVVSDPEGFLTRWEPESATGWHEKLSRIINLTGTKAGLLSFLILIMSSALILSGSRMGICSFITAIILMSIMISNKAPTQRGRISIKKVILILLPVCLMTVWIGLNPVITRFSRISEGIETEGGRIRVWNDTCNLVKDFPALGTGLGTYEYAFPKYKTFRTQKLYDHTHNDYLELMSDTGITGFFIVIAGATYYLFMVTKLWFQRRNPFVRGIAIGCLGGIAYIILHSLTDFNLQIPANALHLSIITGIMHKTLTQL